MVLEDRDPTKQRASRRQPAIHLTILSIPRVTTPLYRYRQPIGRDGVCPRHAWILDCQWEPGASARRRGRSAAPCAALSHNPRVSPRISRGFIICWFWDRNTCTSFRSIRSVRRRFAKVGSQRRNANCGWHHRSSKPMVDAWQGLWAPTLL